MSALDKDLHLLPAPMYGYAAMIRAGASESVREKRQDFYDT